jgi:hypothetical protein
MCALTSHHENDLRLKYVLHLPEILPASGFAPFATVVFPWVSARTFGLHSALAELDGYKTSSGGQPARDRHTTLFWSLQEMCR